MNLNELIWNFTLPKILNKRVLLENYFKADRKNNQIYWSQLLGSQISLFELNFLDFSERTKEYLTETSTDCDKKNDSNKESRFV